MGELPYVNGGGQQDLQYSMVLFISVMSLSTVVYFMQWWIDRPTPIKLYHRYSDLHKKY